MRAKSLPATLVATLALAGGLTAAATANATEIDQIPTSPISSTTGFLGIPNWPNGGTAPENDIWVNDKYNSLRGLPGQFGYLWIESQGIPVDSGTTIRVKDGSIIGRKTDGPAGELPSFKVETRDQPMASRMYVVYRDRYDEDRDGNLTELFKRRLGTVVTRKRRQVLVAQSPTDNVDISAIVDVSGSMLQSDPDNQRADMLDVLLRTARTGDRVGINTFSGSATEIQPMTEIKSYEHAKQLSRLIPPKIIDEGPTNYMEGVNAAFLHLRNDGVVNESLNTRPKLGVFITDGTQTSRQYPGEDFLINWPQYLNTHLRFTHPPSTYTWPVCAVAFGRQFSSRALNRLRRIAEDTGGVLVRSPDPAGLVDAVRRCRGISACEYTVHRRSWPSAEPGKVLSSRARIPRERRMAQFLVSGNRRHTVTLVSPSGTRYSAKNLPEGIRYRNGRTWSMFEIDGPGSGYWKIRVKVEGTEGVGEKVIVRAVIDRCGGSGIPNRD